MGGGESGSDLPSNAGKSEVRILECSRSMSPPVSMDECPTSLSAVACFGGGGGISDRTDSERSRTLTLLKVIVSSGVMGGVVGPEWTDIGTCEWMCESTVEDGCDACAV